MNLLGMLISAGAVAGGLKGLSEALGRTGQSRSSTDLALARSAPPSVVMPSKLKMTPYTVHSMDQRVQHCVRMIQKGRNDPDIRALATKIASQKTRDGKWVCAERDYRCEVRLIYKYMRDNVRYIRDSIDRDTFQHPKRTLEFGGGDCDDYTITMGSLLQAVGYPVWCRIVQTTGNKDYNHIYLIVGLPPTAPTHYMACDASVDKYAGWEVDDSMVIRRKDYPVP